VFTNSLLNLTTSKISECTHEVFVTFRLNYQYDPDATCENVMKFLSDLCKGYEDRITFVRPFCNAVVF